MVLDATDVVATVPRRLFGTMVEHMGRCVYGGVFEPGDLRADPDGFRRDVVDLTRRLGVSLVRYPGGNFASGYDWRDSVGPVAGRPTRRDEAWKALETNRFGLGEFISWARRVEADPMMTLNLGSAGVADALELLDYANTPGGTQWSELRRSHGAADPFDIKLWCLGNEMDGPWQIGHTSGHAYGLLAQETARRMRAADPSLEFVLCGSSNPAMPTFGTWDTEAVQVAYDDVDYVSLHGYFGQPGDDSVAYLASSDDMSDYIATAVANYDRIGARLKSSRRLGIAFDEWNVETRTRDQPPSWARAPRLSEDEFTRQDAVVVGGLLVALLQHSDRVRVACLAQLVNVMAPIRSEPGRPAWRQSIYHPFSLTSRFAHGDVVRVAPRSSRMIVSPTKGPVEPVAMTATHDSSTGVSTAFVVNRSTSDPVRLRLRAAEGAGRVLRHVVVTSSHGPLSLRGNGARRGGRSGPLIAQPHGRDLEVVLPPASWTMVSLAQSPVTVDG